MGAQKAGTTSLYAYLAQHPQIYMSPVKEPSYFAPEQCPKEHVPTWEAYLRHFAAATHEVALGEATATYLWSQTAARNIALRVPHAKIIISLRNPIERAFSQYLHMLTVGATRNSFREQINWGLQHRGTQFSVLWPFLELGNYYHQVTRYFSELPRSQIHICFYEDFARAPAREVMKLYSFLGVDSAFEPDVRHRHNQPQVPKLVTATYLLKKWGAWRYLRKLGPQRLSPRLRSVVLRSRASLRIEPAERALLADYYRNEVTQLSSLLNRDLSTWLDTAC